MAGNRLVALSLAGLLFGAGCTSSTPEEEVLGDAIIVSFVATPTAVDPGGAATLRWTVGDAVSLSLADEDGAAIELSPAALEAREVEVRPAQTTVYVLSALGKSGRLTTGEVKVAVRAAQPRIVSFTATPAEVEAGGPVSLSWATENAEVVQIVAKDGQTIDLGGASPADGATTVHPGASTTYTLRAWSEIGWAEAKVDVSVVGGVDVELIPDRTLVDFGSSTFLRWRSRFAERIVVRAGDAVIVDSTTELSGEISIAPRTVTTYVIEAFAGDATATADAEVRALPVIESFAAGVAGPYARGATIDLEWTARGAQSLRIRSAGGFRFDVPEEQLAEGTTSAVVPADGRFEIEATLDDETVVRTLALPLLDPPAVVSFSVTPDRFTLTGADPEEVTFAWETARASIVEIAPLGEAAIFTSVDEAAAGTTQVPVDRSTTFVFTARNAAGEATARGEVRVYSTPAIDAFEARPSRVGAGEAFELTWIARNASTVRLEQDGSLVQTFPGGNETGAYTAQIAAASNFRLVAANGAGETAERTLRVEVGAPVLSDFTADRLRYGPGSTATFSWVAIGGTKLTLRGPGGAPIASCTIEDLERIPAGDCAVTLPNALGPRTYTLTLANGLGQIDSRSVEIEIVDGPTIGDFYADKTRLTLGESLTFFWSTDRDGNGQAPTLALTDASDTHSLGGADPLQGSAVVTPTRAGARTFRLTATTPGTEASTRDFAVEVLEAPTLVVAVSSAIFNPDLGPVDLSWQTTHAIEVAIDELVPGGTPNRIGLFVDPTLVASGQIQVLPPAPGRVYRVTASNAARSIVSEEASVDWAVPEVTDFYVSPADVGLQGFAQIHWNTAGASSISIAPTPVIEAEPFIDVSGRSSAVEVSLADCGAATMPDDGCAEFQLPFAFPYGGVTRTHARVFLHGALGFDVGYEGASLPAVELPSTAAPFVDLAPYWQPLAQSVAGATRVGRIFVDEDVGPSGRFAVIQWAGFWSAGATSGQPVDLNFEIVLFENGDFDFRYDRMSGPAAQVNGSGASIGHQSQAGTEGRSVAYRREIERGLEGVSIGFRPSALPMAGSFPVIPLFLGTTSYTLTATNPAGSITATASLTANAAATLSGVQVVEAFPEPNQPFTVTWTATGVSEVRVERPQGDRVDDPIDVLCTVLPAAPQSCQLQETTAGVHAYVVRAVGFGAGNDLTFDLEVELLPPFSIDSFTATPAAVTVGDDVTLTWTATDAESLELTANGVAVEITGLPLAGASVTVEVAVDTTFVLTAQSRGRIRTETRTVTAEPPPPPPPPPEE